MNYSGTHGFLQRNKSSNLKNNPIPLNSLVKVCVFLQFQTIKKKKKRGIFLAHLASEAMKQLILPAVASPSFKPHRVKAVCVARVSLPAASQIDA